DSEAWRARSAELAHWAMTRLVNRVDVWGGYQPLNRQEEVLPNGCKLGSTTTRPAKSRRGQVVLTEAILAKHFAGRAAEHIIGLHTTSQNNTSKWGATEVDWHGPDSTGPEINLAVALGWYAKLVALGFRPLLTDSNGKGGYHLRMLYSEP